MNRLTTALAATALSVTTAIAQETEMNFEISGGYAFGETHDIIDMEQSVIAREPSDRGLAVPVRG